MNPETRILDVTPPGFGEKLIAAYLVETEKPVLIETGPMSAAEKLLDQLEALGVRPEAIVVTHIHLDHAGAAGYVAERLNARILVHPRGAKHLVNPSKLWNASRNVLGSIAEVYGEPRPAPEELVVPVEDGFKFDIGGDRLLIVHTPGHASHHMSIFLEGSEVLFTGDSAGVSIEVSGERIRIPTTPPPLRPDLYLESLDKMIRLMPEQVAPTHYGFDPLPGVDYLERHKAEMREWLDATRRLVLKGITDPDEAADMLAEILPEAAKIAELDNPIVSTTFYYSTVWGMIDYWVRVLGDKTLQ